MAITVSAPDVAPDDTFRPTFLVERVSQAIEKQPGLTKTAIRSTVKGRRNDAKDLALELLVAEGFVAERRDDRRAIKHYSTRPYRAASEETLPDPARPCPGHGPTTVPTVPLPYKGHGAVGSAVGTTTMPTAQGHAVEEEELVARAQALADKHDVAPERGEPS
jgi:hypothetical protein